MGTCTLSQVRRKVDDHLITGNNDNNLNFTYASGSWIEFTNSYAGHHSSPYAGRVRLSEADAEPYARELLNWLVTEQGVAAPDGVFDELVRFWAALIGYDDAADCLFGIVRAFRPDQEQVLSSLLSEIDHVTELHNRNPNLIPPDLLDRLQAIARDVSQINAALPVPTVGEVADALRSVGEVQRGLEATRDNATQTSEEQQAVDTFVSLTRGLSDPALGWLVGLTREMIASRALEAKIRLRLRGYLWNSVKHDSHIYLLFGQNAESIVPHDWLAASWDFINFFRCNFGCLVTEAMHYQTILIAGASDAPVPVTKQEEHFLRDYLPHPVHVFQHYTRDGLKLEGRSFQIERLDARNSDELHGLLAERIDRRQPFLGN